MKTLFLAWQDPGTARRWYPVGKLTETDGCCQFVYTQGALDAQHAGFCPLPSFPDLHATYESTQLFPLFSNRVLSPARPDYAEFVGWLSLPKGEGNPFALLARSGGKRATDTLAVFPCPEMDAEGLYHIHLFVHGLSHMTSAAIARAETLEAGETLLVMPDIQNPTEPNALMVRTAERFPGDLSLLGYFPQYLLDDLAHLLKTSDNPREAIKVVVERVNPVPAPVQFRLLCCVSMKWPDGFRPFSSSAYQSITPL